MEQKEKRFSWRLFGQIMVNPLTALIYWCFGFHLYSLCQYGRVAKNLPVLVWCVGCFLLILIAAIYRGLKIVHQELDETKDKKENEKRKLLRIFTGASLACMAVITLYYGALIYRSAQPYNGKLSWYLDDLVHRRTVAIEHGNLYDYGIEGFLGDLDQKLNLPDELYLAASFNLHFYEDGTIHTVETFLCGEDEKGTLHSYLITYDSDKSDRATVYLDGTVSDPLNEEKQFQPMRTILGQVDLKAAVSKWDAGEYGILYYGMRRWDGSDGILYINESGETKKAVMDDENISGYSVSLFVPGREDEVMPIRYLLTDTIGDRENRGEVDGENVEVAEDAAEQEIRASFDMKNTVEEYHLNEREGFRLTVVDAAVGSRYYTLEKSEDGGRTWSVVNPDPFLGAGGGAAGITFINPEVGFMALSHNGGDEAELFRTGDGGKTTERVELPYTVMEEIPNPEEPFDFPSMPYEEDGILNMLIGQGADGDYNGGSKALYRSEDLGVTWEYVREIVRD